MVHLQIIEGYTVRKHIVIHIYIVRSHIVDKQKVKFDLMFKKVLIQWSFLELTRDVYTIVYYIYTNKLYLKRLMFVTKPSTLV